MRTKQRKSRPRIRVSNQSWEEMKASRRNIDHDAAVQRVFHLQKQYRELWSDRMASPSIDLVQILKTLTRKRIPFVLTGAHGIATWTGIARNTQDVDILVKGGRNHTRAVNAMKELYPNLVVEDHGGVFAFYIAGEQDSVIDVTYPVRHDQLETLANPTWTENKKQGIRYRVPSLEEALANKYGAMLTPNRKPDKRLVDAADFTRMVRRSMEEGRKPIDLSRLEILGEMVWPDGGGKEILRLVDEVKAGKAINVQSLE